VGALTFRKKRTFLKQPLGSINREKPQLSSRKLTHIDPGLAANSGCNKNDHHVSATAALHPSLFEGEMTRMRIETEHRLLTA